MTTVRRSRRDIAIVVLGLVGLVVALGDLVRTSAFELSEQTIAAHLPADDPARWARLDANLPLLVVAIEGNAARPDAARVQQIEKELQQLPGVEATWSAHSRPRIAVATDGQISVAHGAPPSGQSPSPLDGVLSPGPRTAVIIAILDRTHHLRGKAAQLTEQLEQSLGPLETPGDRVFVVGEPIMRVEATREARRDTARILPMALLAVPLIGLLLFRSFWLPVYLTTLASITAAFTLAGLRWVEGSVGVVGASVAPLAIGLAVLDGFHLYHRHGWLSRQGHPEPARAAARALWAPCLITTLTTGAGLGVLGWWTDTALVQSIGKWGTFAAFLAYGLTFLFGPAFLSVGAKTPAPPSWPTRSLRLAAVASQRRPRLTLGLWGLAIIAAVVVAPRIEEGVYYPSPLVENHSFSRDLAEVERATGLSLSPIGIELSTQLPGKSGAIRLANAALELQDHLEQIPETRAAIGVALFLREAAAAGNSDATGARVPPGAEAAMRKPPFDYWFPRGDRATRLLVLTAPTSIDRYREIARGIEEFAKAELRDVNTRLDGPAEVRERISAATTRDATTAIPVTLLAIVLFSSLSLGSIRLGGVALGATLAPFALVVLTIAAVGAHWSLAVAVVFPFAMAIAVDDTIHVLWPARRSGVPTATVLSLAVRSTGPALLGTTLVLSACFAALYPAAIQLNREIAIIAPTAFVAALACDVSLVPAVLRLWGRWFRR